VLVAGILHDGLTTVGELKADAGRLGHPGASGLGRGLGGRMSEPLPPTDRRLRHSDDLDALRFDDRGLVPVVAQEASTGDVLMVAWATATP
jgi:hypothetical protein